MKEFSGTFLSITNDLPRPRRFLMCWSAHFTRDVIRRELNLDGRNVIVHTGSLGGL